MKNVTICFLFLLASCGSLPTKDATTFRSVNVAVGQGEYDEAKGDNTTAGGVQFLYQLTEDKVEDGDRNVARGLVSDISLNGSSVGIDGLGSTSFDLDITTLDVRPGLRYYFDTGSRLFQPFLGAAVVGQYAHMETQVAGDESDTFGLGAAARVGFESALGENMRLGLMYDHTWIKHDTDAGDAELDGGAFLLTLGWSF